MVAIYGGRPPQQLCHFDTAVVMMTHKKKTHCDIPHHLGTDQLSPRQIIIYYCVKIG